MTKGQDYYRGNIIERSPVTVYSSTSTAMLEYPYILGRPSMKSPTLSDQASHYIMDSDIGNDDVTNTDVYEAALSVDADVVVPSDVIGDTSASTSSIVEMVEMVDDDDMNVILPLQSDDRLTRREHYNELKMRLYERGYNIDEHIVGVGGVRDVPVQEQIETCFNIRRAVGEDTEIHAFGCGVHHEWVVALRRYPNLVDSVDTTTVFRTVNNQSVFDSRMETHRHDMPRGANSTVLSTMLRETLLYMFNYLVGPDVRDADAPGLFRSERLEELFADECGAGTQPMSESA